MRIRRIERFLPCIRQPHSGPRLRNPRGGALLGSEFPIHEPLGAFDGHLVNGGGIRYRHGANLPCSA